MKQIRIFLYIYNIEVEWSVHVFRDMSTLKSEWEKLSVNADLTVIHIGFDRPDSDLFSKFIGTHKSKVLATASARYSMPKKYRFSGLPIGQIVNDLPVFLALNGWGYECTDDSCSDTVEVNKSISEPKGWIKELRNDYPELFQRTLAAGIFEDDSYTQLERNMNREDRIELAKQRIIRLSPDHKLESIINIINYSPSWLTNLLITDINFNVRVNNVFSKNNITHISDLQGLSINDLLSLPNFGKTSLKVILAGLQAALNKGPSDKSIIITPKDEHYDQGLSRKKIIQNAITYIMQNSNHNGINYYYNIVQNAPEWLLFRKIETISLSTRIRKKFKMIKIKTIFDLKQWPEESLLQLKNFGKFSIVDLNKGIKRALMDGPMVGKDAQKALEESDLLTHIKRTLDELPKKNQYILKRRMGFEVPAGTLQEIGDELGVTRERIRQIEAKYVRRIIDFEFWDDVLIDKLESMLTQTGSPLLFFGLSVLDQWFNGVEKHLETFAYVLDNFCERNITLLTINGQEIVSRISQNEWDDLVREAQFKLQTLASSTHSKQHCKTQVHSLLPPNCLELAEELWISASKNAHFATTQDGESFITGFGRSMENVVEAILTESSTPLHYSKISNLVLTITEKEVDIKRVHKAAAKVGFLFGRGIYGLLQHYPLKNEEHEIIVDQTLNIMHSAPQEKQWHCAEICDSLIDNGFVFNVSLTPYIVNIALQISDMFSYLGRMIWCIKTKTPITTANRILINQAVASILEETGRPMTAKEINNTLTSIRGVKGFIQIQSSDLIVKILPGVWGLATRDIPWSHEVLNELIHGLMNKLKNLQYGLHISEISHAMKTYRQCFNKEDDYTTFMYLASRNFELSTTTSGYIYLTDWGEPRRLSLTVALNQILEEHGEDGVSRSDLPALVKQKTLREIDKRKITEILCSIGAIWNNNSERWLLPLLSEDEHADEFNNENLVSFRM